MPFSKGAIQRRCAAWAIRQRWVNALKAEDYSVSLKDSTDSDGFVPNVTTYKPRRPMSPKEVEYFLSAIRKRRLACFGIIKLRDLDLDKLIDDVDPSHSLTLLECASYFNHDVIVASLMRAGANPTIRHETKCNQALSCRVQLQMYKELPPFFCYIVRYSSTFPLAHILSTHLHPCERTKVRNTKYAQLSARPNH